MPPEPAEEIQREAEEADNAEEADATSWVARNKAFRRNAATWSLSNPASRLVILKSCMAVTASLIHRCLQIGSSEWEAEQELKASRGQARSYRILEAASLHDLKDFFAGMFRLLLQPPRGLAREQLNSQILVLLFRMVSRAVCAMHQLLRRARRSYPYKLFTAMTENCYPNDPSCLHDELTAQFKAWFPEFNADASVHMQVLALSIDLEIAAIEARHAASRRLTMSAVQQWVPDMQEVSAIWTYRQVSLREQVLPSQGHATRVAEESDAAKRRKGAGGAWRAFVHERCKGQKLSIGFAKELSSEYKNLPFAEMQRFQRLGVFANLAWRSGFASFGDRERQRGDRSRMLRDVPAGGAGHDLEIAELHDLSLQIHSIRQEAGLQRRKELSAERSERDALARARESAVQSFPVTRSTPYIRNPLPTKTKTEVA
ncbi:unnamed protein product [Symbiodinium pilosum]|uniref:Uncharacterized protein n=1 Tax=Symbiodinium pilosum TaxID=2952 RepID=A0A812WWS0_SYMPI|nr:unnamed protein product [Symbiodinium pilosum]